MMKTLEQQMAFYAAYHRNRWNKVTHFVGVPTIIFSILIPPGWARVSLGGIEVTLAMAFTLAVLAYYFALGFGSELRERIERLSRQHDAPSREV